MKFKKLSKTLYTDFPEQIKHISNVHGTIKVILKNGNIVDIKRNDKGLYSSTLYLDGNTVSVYESHQNETITKAFNMAIYAQHSDY